MIEEYGMGIRSIAVQATAVLEVAAVVVAVVFTGVSRTDRMSSSICQE